MLDRLFWWRDKRDKRNKKAEMWIKETRDRLMGMGKKKKKAANS
jgi:hypothetical protein